MKKTSRSWYLLALLAVVVLSAAYAARRDLYGRYQGFIESEEAVSAAQTNLQELKTELDTSTTRVRELGADSLEVEAAIRRINRLVREGETVYHFEQAPEPEAQAEPRAEEEVSDEAP